MFLSEIAFDPNHRDVQEDMKDRNRLHQKVMRLFPEYRNGNGIEQSRSRFGVLFRVEDQESVMRLQSRIAPEQSTAIPGYKLSDVKDVEQVYRTITAGAVFRFRLDATPTKRDIQSGRRIGLTTKGEQLNWLARQGERSGFEVLEARAEALKAVKAKHWLYHTVRFDGLLKIKNGGAFGTTLIEGIGQGKPYGLGMLFIVPADDGVQNPRTLVR